MARSMIAAALLWLALVLLPAAGPKSPADGTALLRRVAQVYGGAHRFHFAGVIRAKLTTPIGTDS